MLSEEVDRGAVPDVEVQDWSHLVPVCVHTCSGATALGRMTRAREDAITQRAKESERERKLLPASEWKREGRGSGGSPALGSMRSPPLDP